MADAAAFMIHKVHKIWEEKRIAGTLLIDIKGAFDYIFQAKLIKKVKELDINADLIGWIQSFLINKSIKLVIDWFINSSPKIEVGISQSLLVFLILFLIYISRMFSIIKKQLLYIICISFIDDLGFLTANWSISKIAKIFEKVGKITLK